MTSSNVMSHFPTQRLSLLKIGIYVELYVELDGSSFNVDILAKVLHHLTVDVGGELQPLELSTFSILSSRKMHTLF